jgi:type II secretory pathway pseudopilin PulG
MQRIQEILRLPELEDVSQNVMGLVNFYLAKLSQKQQEAQQQQQMMQAAQQFQQQIGGGGQPGPQAQGPPANPGTSGNPQVQNNELLDETLPGAR